MKRLFCTVVTDYDGTLESPIIFHIRAETMAHAEECTLEQLMESGYSEDDITDSLSIFTFTVTDLDIIEA